MEIIGSLSSISGSVSASFFSGSFVGDGSGLKNIPLNGISGLTVTKIERSGEVAEITQDGNFIVTADSQIQGNLFVTGSITAQQYIISSSVIYATESYTSGSHNFGNSADDYHNFTGSVNITGSLSLNGSPVGTGKLDSTEFYNWTSSATSLIASSSYATTASYLLNNPPAFPYTGSALITGSLGVTGSISLNNTTSTGIAGYFKNNAYNLGGNNPIIIDDSGPNVLGLGYGGTEIGRAHV